MGAESALGGCHRLRGAHLRPGREVSSRPSNPPTVPANCGAQSVFSNFVGRISLPCLARRPEMRFRGGGYDHGRLGQEQPPCNYALHTSQHSPRRAFSSRLRIFLVFWATLRTENERKSTSCPCIRPQSDRRDSERRGPLLEFPRRPTVREG